VVARRRRHPAEDFGHAELVDLLRPDEHAPERAGVLDVARAGRAAPPHADLPHRAHPAPPRGAAPPRSARAAAGPPAAREPLPRRPTCIMALPPGSSATRRIALGA